MSLFKTLSKLVRDCLTGIDGQSFDYARVGGCGGVAVLLAGAIVMIVQGKFGPVEFATALGGLIAGTCIGVKVKESTEPRITVLTQATAPGASVQTVETGA